MASDKKERTPLLIIVVGRKRVGKSFTTSKVIDKYVAGNKSHGIPPRKALILDVNDEFRQYKKLAIEDVKKFSYHPKVECRRIVVF